MQTFPLPVKAAMSDTWAMPTRIVQFGDGYSERSADGLNRPNEIWDVECAFASEIAGANLQTFLETVGGWQAFLWQSPRDTQLQPYIIVQPVGGAVRRGGGSKPYFYTRSLKFKRVWAIFVYPTNISVNPTSFDENVLNPTLNLSAANAQNPTFDLVAGAGSDDNNKFTIIGSTLRFNGSANFEVKASYQIRVRAIDASGGSLVKQMTIGVNDLNEAPTQLTALGFPIVIPTGPTFGSPTTTTSANLSFDANGRLSFTGGGGGGGGGGGFPAGAYATTEIFTDTSTNTQFAVILLLENNPNPTIVADLGNNDPDTVVNSVYTLIGGDGDTDNAVFSISGSQLSINITTDYEIKNEYFIRMRVTTDGGFFTDLPVRVSIVQIPEYPNDIFLSADTIGDLNAVIGTLTTADNDDFSSFTYSIVGGNLEDYLSIGTGGNADKLILTTALDGSHSGYTVQIRATDETGLWIEKTFTLTATSSTTVVPQIVGSATVALIPSIAIYQSILEVTNISSIAIYQSILEVTNISSTSIATPFNYFIIQNP